MSRYGVGANTKKAQNANPNLGINTDQVKGVLNKAVLETDQGNDSVLEKSWRQIAHVESVSPAQEAAHCWVTEKQSTFVHHSSHHLSLRDRKNC